MVSFATTIYTAMPYFLQLEVGHLLEIDQKEFQNEIHQNRQQWDFIIVGGGTAGCVVANRLSRHFTVLLLEAGGDPPSATAVPIFHDDVTLSPEINYLYYSVPQQKAYNRKMEQSAGKMLGGSGSHNSMIYSRGHPLDFDNLAKLLNNSTWKYSSMLKYFVRAEKYRGIWPLTRQHGRKGPFSIETNIDPLNRVWKKAGRELGFSYADPNGPQKPSFNPIDVMQQLGRRVSSYTAYIQPIMSRKTLTVVRYADVYKILISKGTAIGVKYLRHGRQISAFASKEVILCASAYGTPLLLYKSGIGPKKILQAAKIKPILNLPAVGANLRNHLTLKISVDVNPSYISKIAKDFTAQEFKKYLKRKRTSVVSDVREGPQAYFVSAIAKSRNESDWPDYLLIRVNNGSFAHNDNQLYFNVYIGREFGKNFGSFKLNASAYLQGERDSVKLAIVDYKLFKNRNVIKSLQEGVMQLKRVIKTKAFKQIGARLSTDAHCGLWGKISSKSYWKCFFKKYTTPIHHAAGTCSIGRERNIKNSVVDTKFCVYGIRNLRVVDASVLPRLINAPLNGAIVAIAEKASEIINGDYRDSMK